MPEKHDPTENRLLAAFAPDEGERIFPHLQSVDLRRGDVLYEPGDTLSHVYFPTGCVVSLLYVLDDGASAEIAVVGDDGLIGISLFMGGETTTNRAVVQSAGHAYRLSRQRLKNEFNRHGKVQDLVLRYTQALITQMAQAAVCNRHHTLDQQLCRWLLLSLDRLPTNKLEMTQKLIANTLGVRREGVAVAAGKLQRLRAMRYSRGQITVLDRPQLERLCCECYSVVKKEEDRLLPHVPMGTGRAKVQPDGSRSKFSLPIPDRIPPGRITQSKADVARSRAIPQQKFIALQSGHPASWR